MILIEFIILVYWLFSYGDCLIYPLLKKFIYRPLEV